MSLDSAPPESALLCFEACSKTYVKYFCEMVRLTAFSRLIAPCADSMSCLTEMKKLAHTNCRKVLFGNLSKPACKHPKVSEKDATPLLLWHTYNYLSKLGLDLENPG